MNDPQPPTLIGLGKTGEIRAQINQRGAELWTLTDRDGTPLQWSGDPQVWSGRAPILFPIVGSLAGGVYRYNGGSYPLHRHGFARHAEFSVVEQTETSVLLRLEADHQTRKVYPFDFQLDLRFTCAVDALAVAACVRNLGEETMPFSFGFHPALRWPLEPGAPRAGHAIVFSSAEPAPISRLDADGLILAERQPSPVVGRRLDLRDELFAGDALIFTDLASRSVDYGANDHGAPIGRHIRVEFDNFPLLGVWTKPGARYICIEPWQGIADPEGFSGDIFAKPGIIPLAPGTAWHSALTLTSQMPQ